MKMTSLVILVQFLTVQLWAVATYYKGQQASGIAGETVDCYLEAEFLNDAQAVNLRIIAADLHDGELMGLGPIQAQFDSERQGYLFSSNDEHRKLQGLYLDAQSSSVINFLELVILDGNHADQLQCNNLQAPQGDDLALVIEKFKNFDSYLEDEDHGDHHDHH